ncbi:MAG: ribonucleotide-diphosphate reductase subunit beta, partial [Gammaproteobacteria bacterium]
MLNWDKPLAAFQETGTAPPADLLQDPTEDTTAAGASGLEDIALGAGRIRVDDKRIINCRADLNQLVPFKYQWA